MSKWVFQENKTCQIFRRTNMCISGGKKCSFFGKFDVLCFLETPVLKFVLLPYYRRNMHQYTPITCKHKLKTKLSEIIQMAKFGSLRPDEAGRNRNNTPIYKF